MRINDAWDFRRVMIGDGKRKLPAGFVAKISAEECAQPRSSAFRDRNDDGVGVGKLSCATAKIPSRTQHPIECATGAQSRPAWAEPIARGYNWAIILFSNYGGVLAST